MVQQSVQQYLGSSQMLAILLLRWKERVELPAHWRYASMSVFRGFCRFLAELELIASGAVIGLL